MDVQSKLIFKNHYVQYLPRIGKNAEVQLEQHAKSYFILDHLYIIFIIYLE